MIAVFAGWRELCWRSRRLSRCFSFFILGSGGINDDSSGFNDGCGDVVEGCVYWCVGVEVGFGVGFGVVGVVVGGGLSNSVGDGCGWCCWVGLAVGNTASAAPVSLSEILD